MRAHALGLAVTTLIVTLQATPARPCSCIGGSPFSWLTETGEAPLELRGPVLFGVRTSHPDQIERALSSVVVERYDCDGAVSVPAVAEVLDDDSILIVPEPPMLPGQTWRFAITGSSAPGRTPTIVLTVRDQSLRAMKDKPVLRIGDATWGPLQVRASASCTSVIPATQRLVSFELPAEYRGIEGSLLYHVQVDGKDWRPSSSLCSPILPGRSWARVGTELLYGVCSHEDRPIRISGDGGLRAAWHSLKMRAVLPGTSIAFTLGARVDLRCASKP